MDLQKYYEFFGNTSFGGNPSISFMQDGSFVIYDKQNNKVTCYTSNCEPFFETNRLRDVVVLCETSTVVVREPAKGGFSIFKNGKNVAFILSDVAKNCTMITENNSSILLTNSRADTHIISTSSKNGYEFNTVSYIHPHLFKEDGYGNVVANSQSTQIQARFFNVNGETYTIENVYKVNFLYGKRAVVEFCNGTCELVSYENDENGNLKFTDCLLHSDKKGGIEKFGNYAVIFENKLVATAEDGTFLCEVDSRDDEDDTVFTPYATKIKPYIVEVDGFKGYYPASSYSVYDVNNDALLVFFYHGKFYPVFIDAGLDKIEPIMLDDSISKEYADIVFQVFPS